MKIELERKIEVESFGFEYIEVKGKWCNLPESYQQSLCILIQIIFYNHFRNRNRARTVGNPGNPGNFVDIAGSGTRMVNEEFTKFFNLKRFPILFDLLF